MGSTRLGTSFRSLLLGLPVVACGAPPEERPVATGSGAGVIAAMAERYAAMPASRVKTSVVVEGRKSWRGRALVQTRIEERIRVLSRPKLLEFRTSHAETRFGRSATSTVSHGQRAPSLTPGNHWRALLRDVDAEDERFEVGWPSTRDLTALEDSLLRGDLDWLATATEIEGQDVIEDGSFCAIVSGVTGPVRFRLWIDESTSLLRRLEAHEPIETDEPTDARQIPAGEALGGFPEATPQSRDAIVTIIQSAPLGDDATYRRFEVDEALMQASGNRARFYEGIGIKFTNAPGIGEVSDIFEDSPASRAGLAAGDVIAAVNGTATNGLSTTDIVERMRGPARSRIELEIDRNGVRFPLALERAWLREPD